jgi:uncharacterized protein (DUF1499 family)
MRMLMIWIPLGLVALVGIALVAGRAGLLSGSAPNDLGVREGRLKPPSERPNSVSSQAALHPNHPRLDYARIEPLPISGSAEATLDRIAQIVGSKPGGRVVKREPGYLQAVFETKLMRYQDDVEFWADAAAGVVQVRSASRVGYSDRGVNRSRIESIRRALAS